MALYRTFPMPKGEVDTFFSTMQLTTNFVDGTRPFAEDEGGKDHGTDATYEMIDSLRNVINNDL